MVECNAYLRVKHGDTKMPRKEKQIIILTLK